ncbi:MAG: response regulator transcription factor [Planctomycetota bacterium]|nr:MAG: response regulator transcription factor [Planctomycetota bacterium]
MEPEPVVFVVDDDAAVRNSLLRLIQSVGLKVRTFRSGEEFLEDFDPDAPGCLVLDVRMRGMSGLDVQKKLTAMGAPIPIIILSGHGDVPMAVRALKAGASDFMEKPFSPQILIDRIRQVIEQDAETRRQRAERKIIQHRLSCLSDRQREVLDLVVAGLTTNQIARRLSLSPKTVYAHRAEALGKMKTGSIADAARQLVLANSH